MNTHPKNSAITERISLFAYFLDLILIQSWRPKWKVNSIIRKPVISRQTLDQHYQKVKL